MSHFIILPTSIRPEVSEINPDTNLSWYILKQTVWVWKGLKKFSLSSQNKIMIISGKQKHIFFKTKYIPQSQCYFLKSSETSHLEQNINIFYPLFMDAQMPLFQVLSCSCFFETQYVWICLDHFWNMFGCVYNMFGTVRDGFAMCLDVLTAGLNLHRYAWIYLKLV